MVKRKARQPDRSVTYVIFETIKPEFRTEYEQWLTTINRQLMAAPGFVGVEVNHPRPESNEYAIIVRFETLEQLKAWQLGPTAQQLIEQGRPYIQEVRTQWFEGLGMLFHKDIHQRPPYWKRVVVSIIAVYPLIIVVGWLLNFVPKLDALPRPVLIFISSIFVSMGMVWPVLPWVSKQLKPWLNRKAKPVQ